MITQIALWAIATLFTLSVAVMGYIFKRQINRLDDVSKKVESHEARLDVNDERVKQLHDGLKELKEFNIKQFDRLIGVLEK